jgi:hypothetical protein
LTNVALPVIFGHIVQWRIEACEVEDSRALLADQHVAQAVTDATMIFQRRRTFSDYVFADGICRQKLDKILKIQLVTFHA